MHEDTDDTVPHAVRDRLARQVVDVDEVEVALGDTVVRAGGGLEVAVAPEPREHPELPPVPAALRPRHRVRVGLEEPVELDRPVLIGRHPRPGRVPAGEPPRLVSVESADGGISSTHLEVREQGSVVVATDMRTLNGSEVMVPGSPVQSLQRGASVVVTPGTRIDLGEGVVVEVLGPVRAVPRAGGAA
ncbi:hypothetical protein H4J02_05925 [Protaetiibacter sp. SSC-01]|uniref:hypothetical protein n=1 Tax=Protaetiibacter sp. SSC-01 TaxID=2759943 RepID=UPI001656E37C|nr:hypothetical protein [Protaetiibacter sp. SSC-01]QNO38538.1 hypothetical protein H4J02_05925 [Protaetiibacter sp. SSC-01]